ncbi:hypothetical protein ACFL0M_02510 [Thermodesulfobacteriota bacterium]
MVDTDSSKFKLRFDDESPDTQLQEDVENLRIDKLSQKINLFAILIPCLLGVVLVFGYLDVKKRFENVHSLGTSDVQTLSKDLDSKFSSLSVRQSKIEALLAKKLSDIEKIVARLEKNLDKTQKALRSVRSSSPDKKELAGIITELDETLAPITTDLKTLSSQTKALNQKYVEGSAKLTAAINNNLKKINALKSDISTLTSTKVDKIVYDLTNRHEEKFFQQKIEQANKNLSKKIDEIQIQIKVIAENQKKISALKPAPLKKPAKKATIKTTAPKPGTIIEQEIKK